MKHQILTSAYKELWNLELEDQQLSQVFPTDVGASDSDDATCISKDHLHIKPTTPHLSQHLLSIEFFQMQNNITKLLHAMGAARAIRSCVQQLADAIARLPSQVWRSKEPSVSEREVLMTAALRYRN